MDYVNYKTEMTPTIANILTEFQTKVFQKHLNQFPISQDISEILLLHSMTNSKTPMFSKFKHLQF